MQINRSLPVLLLGAVLAAFATAPALASPFGPATAGIVFASSPSVVLNSGAGTVSFNSLITVIAPTGSLSGEMGASGTSTGLLNFSTTPGTTKADTISNFLVISDGAGGTFNFNANSAETTLFSNNPGVSTNIGLYILGSMGDTNLNESFTPTAFLISLSSSAGQPFTVTASLSSPPPVPVVTPTKVPEPGTLALLAMGFLGVGLARRTRPQ